MTPPANTEIAQQSFATRWRRRLLTLGAAALTTYLPFALLFASMSIASPTDAEEMMRYGLVFGGVYGLAALAFVAAIIGRHTPAMKRTIILGSAISIAALHLVDTHRARIVAVVVASLFFLFVVIRTLPRVHVRGPAGKSP